MAASIKLPNGTKVYGLAAHRPVARFYYQGTHSHPVRRTVLVIENKSNVIVGYELREGSTVRTFAEARQSVKSYRKDRIARWGDYCRLRQSRKTSDKPSNETTLQRFSISSLFSEGM